MLSLPSFLVADEAAFELKWTGEEFSFKVVREAPETEWLLQHSTNGMEWTDLIYLERPATDQEGASVVCPEATLSFSALPNNNIPIGLFRVREVEVVDPFYKDYLAARSRWRASGLASYKYGFRWNTMIFWSGTVTVMDNVAVSYTRTEAWPPFFEDPPLFRTIDGLFNRIEQAWFTGAASINVTWHPEFGYPSVAAIDQSLMIADEEQYWAIETLELLP